MHSYRVAIHLPGKKRLERRPTLAGSLLIANSPRCAVSEFAVAFYQGIYGFFYWATGTWWIPMLLVLGLWRYVYKRFPFRYDPLYWGAVFPLGMYAASTWQMNAAMGFDFLQWIPIMLFYAAAATWRPPFVA